jgi:translocator assembly and maintenance protein 41
MHHLQRDLEEWETLYLAGRLQKPVKILRQDAKLGLATKMNLENAIRISLLMLPERFTEEDLYLKIAGLSYSGDFRMRIGENPYKVFNIVYAQMDAFREKYDPIIEDLPNISKLADGSLEVRIFSNEKQDMNPRLRGTMIGSLPKSFQEKLRHNYLWSLSREGLTNINRDEPLFTQQMGQFHAIGECASKTIRDVVARPALIQSFKGIATAGLIKSVKYAAEKVKKKVTAKPNLDS